MALATPGTFKVVIGGDPDHFIVFSAIDVRSPAPLQPGEDQEAFSVCLTPPLLSHTTQNIQNVW